MVGPQCNMTVLYDLFWRERYGLFCQLICVWEFVFFFSLCAPQCGWISHTTARRTLTLLGLNCFSAADWWSGLVKHTLLRQPNKEQQPSYSSSTRKQIPTSDFHLNIHCGGCLVLVSIIDHVELLVSRLMVSISSCFAEWCMLRVYSVQRGMRISGHQSLLSPCALQSRDKGHISLCESVSLFLF